MFLLLRSGVLDLLLHIQSYVAILGVVSLSGGTSPMFG